MHVTQNHFQPNANLDSLGSNNHSGVSDKTFNGRSVSLQNPAHISSTANTTFQEIKNANVNSTETPHQTLPLSIKQRSIAEISFAGKTEKSELLSNFALSFKENPSKHMYVMTRGDDGKKIAKNINHEDIKSKPLSEDHEIITVQEFNGKLLIHDHENNPLELDEIHDEHGQTREFQFFVLDDDLYSQLQDIVQDEIKNYVLFKKSENLDNKNVDKDLKSIDKSSSNSKIDRPTTRYEYEYDPAALAEKKNGDETLPRLNRSTYRMALCISIMAMNKYFRAEAKRETDERSQVADSIRIDKQKDTQDYKLEMAKEQGVEFGNQRDANRKEEIRHNERG